MNPNSLHPSGIHHHHPQPHHYSPLQPPPSLHHSHQTHLQQPHPPTHAHAHPHPHSHSLHPHPGHHPSSQQQPTGSSNPRDAIDDQQVQQSNIQNYKNSANAAFQGYIQTTHDALLIFQACSLGLSPRVTRRLHERERRQIVSGTVYVFDEAEAGIKRWTDGRLWSPSRILNNFLVYREIDQKRQPAPSTGSGPNSSPGSTATVNNDSNSRNNNNNNSNSSQSRTTSVTTSASASISAPGTGSALSINASAGPAPGSPVSTHPPQHTSSPQHHVNQKASATSNVEINGVASSEPNPSSNPEVQSPPSVENQAVGGLQRPANREREQERALVGSLTTTYKFRANGLVKKTISVGGMHMISYYRMEDVISGRLRTPTTDPSLRQITIAPRFLQPSLFRVPPTWGRDVNGAFYINDEGPDQPSPTMPSGLTSTTNTPATFHNGHRPGAMGAPTNSVSGLLTTHQPSSRTNGPDGIPTAPISRPGSSAGSAGSPGAPSPASPHAFPTIMSAANLGGGGGSSAGAAGVRVPFGRLPSGSSGQVGGAGTNATSGGGSRTAAGQTGSTRYEPYPRPNRSPPLPPPLTSASSAMAETQQPSYYGHSQSAAGNSGYSTHAFLPDSHPSSLVSSQPRQSTDRNGAHDSTVARDGRSFESMGQVSYGNSGSYRPTTTASGANESLYGPYPTSTGEVTNTQHRSASVPPGSFGLPPIDRLGGAGSQGSSSGPVRGGGGEMQFSNSGSGGQPLGGRLSSTGAHGGGYAAYMSAVPGENGAFRSSTGGGLVGRENQQYGSSLANNAPVPSSPSSGLAGSQAFIYPPPSSAPPSTTTFPPQYPFCASMHHHSQHQTHGDQLGRRASGGVSSAVAGGMVGSAGAGGGEAGRAAIRAAGLARISSGGGSTSAGGNRQGESVDTNTSWSNHQVGTSASSSAATNISAGATTMTTGGGLSHGAMKAEENGG